MELREISPLLANHAIVALAILKFVRRTLASAVDVYHGIDQGNSDLSTQRGSAEDFVDVQPSIGDSVNRYQGWANDNPDLFKADRSGPNGATSDPNIYHGVAGNSDLQF